MKKKRILVAALNWGFGHATRCIPIIRELQEQNFEPIIASDGQALALLRKEFPDLPSEELPSYNIEYASNPSLLKWKFFLESPKMVKAIKAEKKFTGELVEKYNPNGIISDNRLGVRYEYLKSVFITHQLNVLSGNTTWLSSRLHKQYIRRFDECWIPDVAGPKNLSGVLGHMRNTSESVKYMGPLSRLNKKDLPLKYQVMIILSGPEPQRSFLEKIILEEFRETSEKTLLVRGVINDENFLSGSSLGPLEIKNYLFGRELEDALNSSRLIVARSGYTTLMDLAKLEKKAFFIPTPGQFEQEYLAERLTKLGIAPFCSQNDFKQSLLEQSREFSGFNGFDFSTGFGSLLALFKGK